MWCFASTNPYVVVCNLLIYEKGLKKQKNERIIGIKQKSPVVKLSF
jgi:hypothetical protein